MAICDLLHYGSALYRHCYRIQGSPNATKPEKSDSVVGVCCVEDVANLCNDAIPLDELRVSCKRDKHRVGLLR